MKKMKFTLYILMGMMPAISLKPALLADEEEDESGQVIDLGALTVTVNKIEEDLVDVPQSVSVVGESLIDERGIKNIFDLVEGIPNVELSPATPARPLINIRGLNTSNFTNNNPIVIYYDGIPYSDSYGFDLSLANAERIEVLRGPQGTLYGKDAIGGVINVVTKEPTNHWTTKAGLEYGSLNYRELMVDTSGALVEDTLFLSLSGQYRADDGWITNNFPGNERDANKFDDRRLNATLTYQPTDAFRAKLVYTNDHSDSFGFDGYGILGGTGEFSDFSREDVEDVSYEFETREEIRVNSQAFQASYDFDRFTLNSVTTRRVQKMEALYDLDGGDNPALANEFQFDNQDRETWTQELTLRSNAGEDLKYVAGVYLDTEERQQGPYGQEFFGTNFNADSVTDSETSAIFGQVIYPLSDQLDLTLGARYQSIDKEIDMDFIVENMPLPPDFTTFFDGVVFSLEAEKDWTKFLPRAALNYKLDETSSVYGSYSVGYMPGGFNFFATGGSEDDNSFEPQVSTNFEVGYKRQIEDLSVGAAVFYMDIEDIHVFRTDEFGNFFTDNARAAHSMGVEVEVAYQVTDALELSASAGLIEAEYDDYDAGLYTYDGETIEQTPDYTLNFAAAYYHPSRWYARADLDVTGATAYYDSGRPDPETAFPTRGAYSNLDTRVGYFFGNWEVYAFARNLTDEEYPTSYRSANLGFGVFSSVTFNDPRTWGVGSRVRF